MGPTRNNARARPAQLTNDMLPDDEQQAQASSSSAVVTASGTPSRASPYIRTPTKHVALREQTTPVSRTNSPSMIRDIFQMISPFRTFSRASRSAAFGGEDDDSSSPEVPPPRIYPALEDLQSVERTIVPDEMDIEEPAPTNRQLGVPKARVSRSTSPRPRHSLPAPPKPLPLADHALLTPGIHKYGEFDQEPSYNVPALRPPPLSYTSPVSRNYDLLAQFFSEKQRGGSSGLSEVEVEGCIRLIEESMAAGRDLQSEFQQSSNVPASRYVPPASVHGESSRASSAVPSALPSSQTMGSLFHPGTRALPASSSAYSFLAPRPLSSSTSGTVVPAATRRRPIYLGPGMSSLSLTRKRTLAPSARTVGFVGRSGMPRSATDPQLSRNNSDQVEEETLQHQPGPEEAKRRRTNVAEQNNVTPDHTARFDSSFERHTDESSALAKQIASHASPRGVPSGSVVSPLKRAAPAAEIPKTSPPKTRTASALQDILKDSPPVREAAVPIELVNPYQSAVNIAKTTNADSSSSPRPIRSARANMLTRAKAKEVANAKAHKTSVESVEPPKESVLELIERTAPRARSTRKRAVEQESTSVDAQAKPAETQAQSQQTQPQQDEPSVDARKVQRTEEVQRRLEALTKAKAQSQSQKPPQQQQQQQQRNAPTQSATPSAVPATPQKATVPAPSVLSAGLVPPQYTASKPKKPSPLSVAIQAPESPGSETESSQPDARVHRSLPGSTTSAVPVKSAPAPSSGFSFSLPKSSNAQPVMPVTSSTKVPETTSSVSGFSSLTPTPAPAPKPIPIPKPTVAAVPFTSNDVGDLPTFDFVFSVPNTSQSDADRAWKAEIQTIAESALPEFTFTYEVETVVGEKKAEPISTPSFAKPVASAPAIAATETSEDSETSGEDPSKVQSSGLLGEGEGEEGEATDFEIRAKFWKFDSEAKAYKDLGICVAKIKSNKETTKRRLLARNEANGKVAVNFHIYKTIKVSRDKNVCSFLGFSETGQPTQFRTKVKTDDKAQEFQEALDAAAASA